MRYFLLTVYISISFFSFLKAEVNNNQLLTQLSAVNNEWSKQPECKKVTEATSINDAKNFNDWIAAHLRLVEQILRTRDVSNLSSSQKKNRLHLLDELNGYWHARPFPVNDYLPYKNPIFIDRTGNHCAVGYLMQQSGAEVLAQKISSEQKFAYVHEIKAKGVKEWADENGFTIDELAWIQPAYPVNVDAQDMEGGLNGTVNVITPDQTSQTIYAGGSFSHSVGGGVACNNIAAWISGFAGWDWIALGNGLNGTVRTLLLHNNKLYVGGEFTMANGVNANHIAVYDISLGQWQAMGSLDSTVRTLTVYNNEIYAGGDFTGYVSKWNGTQWQDVTQGFIYGSGVRTLEAWNNMLVIGGNFELATGALRKHVATYNGSQMGTLGFGTLTPVNDFTEHEGKLYAACDVISGTDTCALAVYENFQWDVKLKPFGGIGDAFDGTSIRSLYSFGGQLLAGGEFMSSSGMMYGGGLMAVRENVVDTTTYTLYQPLASPDQAVNYITMVNNDLYFGGTFIMNGYQDTLNHIGYLQVTPVGIDNTLSSEVSLQVFPNPANTTARIQSGSTDKLERIEMYDVSGRKVIQESVNAMSKDISLQQLSAGIYNVRVFTKSGWGNVRLVKE